MSNAGVTSACRATQDNFHEMDRVGRAYLVAVTGSMW